MTASLGRSGEDLAAAYLKASGVRASHVRFDVAAVLDGRLEVVEDAF